MNKLMLALACGVSALALPVTAFAGPQSEPAQSATADPLAPTGHWSANTQGHAPVPPMGWNSWNAFNSDIDEAKIVGSAQALVDSGLSRLGYRYVDIDDGWWLKRSQPDGRLVIRTSAFPSAKRADGTTSFRPLTDKLHAMGLKAGIYSDMGRNSCGQIYTPDFKNQPEGSVAEREVGLYGHVDQDIELFFAQWGFDLLKVDGCGLRGLPADAERVKSGMYRALPPLIDSQSLAATDVAGVRDLYEQVGDAIHRHAGDKDYVFSICLWGSADVRSWAKDVGNISRTSDDIQPIWARLLTNLDTTSHRALYAHPGSWNDADMLFIGKGDFDEQHMTEARSHFALWAMLNSPLIIGYDLRNLTPALMSIFGNADIVALNQDPAGNQAVLAHDSDEVQIFVKTLADGDKAVAVFNRTGSPVKAALTAEQLKLRPDAPVTLVDLWSKARHEFTGEEELTLSPHETLIFRASGKRRLPDGIYLSEAPGRVNPADDGVPHPMADPSIYHSIAPWMSTHGPGEYPQYAGWGGAQADRAPFNKMMRIGGKPFDTGLGVLANSRFEVRNGEYSRFSAKVGVDDSGLRDSAPVTFAVYGDGKLLTRSRPMRFGDAPQPITASVKDVKIVELVARSEGGDAQMQPVGWGDAALTN